MATLHRLLLIALLATPVAAYGQSGGGAGGGGGGSSAGGASAGTSGTGATSGPTAGSPSAAGTPSAGSAGAGSQAVSGAPSGPANLGGNNNSINDPSGAGNATKVPGAPGTNSVGTANSTGAPSGGNSSTGTVSQTTGSALNRSGGQSGGRIDGTVTRGPDIPGDAAIRAEDQVVDKKIKSICKGCWSERRSTERIGRGTIDLVLRQFSASGSCPQSPAGGKPPRLAALARSAGAVSVHLPARECERTLSLRSRHPFDALCRADVQRRTHSSGRLRKLRAAS
jgi:PPE-repeat protein